MFFVCRFANLRRYVSNKEIFCAFSFVLFQVRQLMTEATSFGVALAAGKAIGIWDFSGFLKIPIVTEKFNCSISEEGRLGDFDFFLVKR